MLGTSEKHFGDLFPDHRRSLVLVVQGSFNPLRPKEKRVPGPTICAYWPLGLNDGSKASEAACQLRGNRLKARGIGGRGAQI